MVHKNLGRFNFRWVVGKEPSFRRKPESRILGSRPALLPGISWIPACAGTTVLCAVIDLECSSMSAHGELVEPPGPIKRFVLRQAQDEREKRPMADERGGAGIKSAYGEPVEPPGPIRRFVLRPAQDEREKRPIADERGEVARSSRGLVPAGNVAPVPGRPGLFRPAGRRRLLFSLRRPR